MLLTPNVCFRTMSSVPPNPFDMTNEPNTSNEPMEQTVVVEAKSSEVGSKRRRGVNWFDDVSTANIMAGGKRRPRRSAIAAQVRIQAVQAVEAEVAEEQEVFEGDPNTVWTEDLMNPEADVIPDDLSLESEAFPTFPDNYGDLGDEFQRRSKWQNLAIKRLQYPERFVEDIEKKSPEEVQVAIAKQILIAKARLKIYPDEWVNGAFPEEDVNIVNTESPTDPRHSAAVERLEKVRQWIHETRYGMQEMDVQELKLWEAAKSKTFTAIESGQIKDTATTANEKGQVKYTKDYFDFDSRCDFDEKLLVESKKEFGFDFKINWKCLVGLVHRSGVDGLWSEMTAMMNLVRMEICAKVDEYVVQKLKAGPKLE